ncbi:MAG TPA: hypothetical protein VJ770_13325 [Stellaceae bacterium]|jgi:hypothetical protein|nr:hypothetical protein [Stellaceae bacterium]
MRLPVLPIAASFALLAAPAFAQTSGATATQPYNAAPAASAPAYNQNQGATATQPETTTPSENTPAFRPQAAAPTENAPAYAQTPQTQNPALSGSTQQNAEGSSQNLASNNTQVSLDTQQKLKESLQQNGFQDVTVTPRSFVIHAKAPDGSRIVMIVSPDQMRGVIMSGSSSQPGQWGHNGSSTPYQNGSSNPYHNGLNR